jgi:ribosomal protein S18 acetylase RimI-like enzyme
MGVRLQRSPRAGLPRAERAERHARSAVPGHWHGHHPRRRRPGRAARQIGLGVDDHNHRAASLYLRLGYRETDCHYLDRYEYVDGGGVELQVADPCRFLVKQLAADSDARHSSGQRWQWL